MSKVTPTTVTNGVGSGSATSYTTASVTPTVGHLLTLAVYNRRSGAAGSIPTVSGLSATWTQVVTKTRTVGDNSRFTIFRSILSSSQTGALTIDFSGVTQQMSHWHLVSWAGARTSGSNAADGIAQSVGCESDTGSMTGTLSSSITNPSNATYGGMGLVATVGSGITPADGETELVDQTNNGSGLDWRTQFQWEQGTDNSMSWSFTNDTGENQPLGAVIEVVSAEDAGLLFNFI